MSLQLSSKTLFITASILWICVLIRHFHVIWNQKADLFLLTKQGGLVENCVWKAAGANVVMSCQTSKQRRLVTSRCHKSAGLVRTNGCGINLWWRLLRNYVHTGSTVYCLITNNQRGFQRGFSQILIRSFCSLSCDRSTASSKASYPLSAIKVFSF